MDTTIQDISNVDWQPVFDIVAQADIAPRKFIGQYNFSQYDDATTGLRGWLYSAKTTDLLTRTLQINIDPTSDIIKIKSVYIETAEHGFWSDKSRKILYVPLHILQIQEKSHTLLGKARDLRVEYRFMRDDDE